MVLEQQILHLGDDHERFLKVGSPSIGLTTFLLAPTAASASETSEDDDHLFSDQDYDKEAFQAMDEIVSRAYQAMNAEMEGRKQREAEERQRAEEGMERLEALEKEQLQALRDLRQASCQSRYRPFFTHKKSFELEDESDDEFAFENEDDLPPKTKAPDAGMSHKAWFKKPKYMSNIVYNYFADVVESQIKRKMGVEPMLHHHHIQASSYMHHLPCGSIRLSQFHRFTHIILIQRCCTVHEFFYGSYTSLLKSSFVQTAANMR
ncbi:hypothetical protein C8J56DRAFT_1060490 [Mycena floridula]|nr:hypothetical protein C8J56DRAFT_1060490 [Mycena floridula]